MPWGLSSAATTERIGHLGGSWPVSRDLEEESVIGPSLPWKRVNTLLKLADTSSGKIG